MSCFLRVTKLAYDAENHLLSSTAGVSYTYDGYGRRVKKSNGTLYWYGVSGEVLVETDSAGNSPKEFVFFAGQRVARRDSSGAVNYFFSDHLGSARIVTDSAGTIVEDSDFYPFGGERVVLSTLDNNYKFTGKERDTESGLDYFGARHHASNLGRFIQPDAPFADQHVGDPQSWNLYAYVRNNPLRFTDPTGRAIMGGPMGGGEGKLPAFGGGSTSAFGGGWFANTWSSNGRRYYVATGNWSLIEKEVGPQDEAAPLPVRMVAGAGFEPATFGL